MFVVVGAGPAGLATAWQLQRSGHEVLVLEAGDRIGGMAASITVGGVRVDLGSHRLHPATPAWLLEELRGLVDLQVRRRNGRIRLGGRWLPFPLTPVGLARGLPPRLAARAFADAVTSPLRSPVSDRFGEVLRAGLGPTVYRAFHEPYAWKLYGTDPERLAGELARRRVTASTPGAVARRVVRGVRQPATFLYPATGFGAIVEALADRVPVETGRRVTRLIEGGDRVIVGLADGRVVTADHVFATVPSVTVADWLARGLGRDDAGLRRPPMRAVVLVYLVLDRPRYTPYDAHYLPERHLLVSRLSEPTNYRTGLDPTDRTVLCAEIPCWSGDDVWSSTDAELALRVGDDLARCGLPAGDPVEVHVERLPSVYPVMTPDALDAAAAAEAAVTASERVTVLGRQGLFTQDNTHHALEMGVHAARSVRDDGSFNEQAWRTARRSFHDYVVED